MKKGGVGGAKTVTGLHFEKKVHLLTKIVEIPGYEVRGNDIYYQGKYLASSYPKNDLYEKFLRPKGINHLDYVSKKYLPDEAIYVPSHDTLYVVEMKFQGGGGSVDEKPQTADFKRKVYLKLTAKLKLNVEYCLVLSDFFNKPRYDDAYQYIREAGCNYFFNELPLSWLNFPQPIIPEGQHVPEDVEVTA